MKILRSHNSFKLVILITMQRFDKMKFFVLQIFTNLLYNYKTLIGLKSIIPLNNKEVALLTYHL